MIRRNTVGQTYQLCIGEYADLRVGFVSDEILTDKVLKFNPGIYTIDGEPQATAFQIKYPVAPGKYEMQKVSCKNYRAYIEVISPYRFIIEYHFFVTKDIGGWIPDAPLVLSSAFNSSGFSSVVGFYIKVQNQSVVYTVPVEVQSMCEIDTRFIYEDFIPGKDLKISVEIPNLSASNSLFVGVIKDNVINQSDNIVPGLILSYSEVNNGAQNFLDLPNILTAQSKGFQNVNGKASAEVWINGANLLSNGVYRIYIIYYAGGSWRSCVSERIRQKTSRSPIEPVVITSISDIFGNTINTACGKGMSNTRDYFLIAAIDIADYNAKLLAQGYTGTFAEYFESAKAFVGLTANANNGITLPMTSDPSGGTHVILNFNTQKSQAFVIVQIKMKIEGVDDVINIVFDLNYNAARIPFNYQVLDSEGVVTEICDGEDYIGNKLWECDLFQSIDGGPYVNNSIINGLDINIANMPFDAKVCFKAVCDIGVGPESECECPECDTLEVIAVESGEINGSKYLDLTLPPDIQNYQATAVYYQWGSTEYTAIGPETSFQTDPIDQNSTPIDIYRVVVSFEFYKNGCLYQYENIEIQTSNAPANPYSETQTLIVHPLTTNQDCDCPEPLICNNYAAFEVTCDRELHEVSISLVKNLTSPLDSESDQCSLDGGLTFIPRPNTITGETNVYLKYNATFTDGCPAIDIEQVVRCEKYLEVMDERFIEIETDSSGELAINITSSFGNTPIQDILYVSLDGGENWQEFDLLGDGYIPIQLTGGETVMAYTNTVFEGQTEDIVAQGILPNPIQLTNCPGYDGYGLEVTYDEETGEYTVTKTGDETVLIKNEILWTLNGGDPINGGGIPYFGPFVGEGLFVAAWIIQLENCVPKIIHGAKYGKRCIQICNLDDIGINPPQVTIYNNVDACCDEENCPSLNLTITCINRTLTLTGFVSGSTITWTGPAGFTGSGDVVVFPQGTPSGIFTATIVDGACTYTADYNYTQPNAGQSTGDPVLV